MATLDPRIASYSVASPKSKNDITENEPKFELYIKPSSTRWVDPEVLADEIISTRKDQYIGWLDSSRKHSPYSRMSVLSTEPAFMMSYSTLHHELKIKHKNGNETKTYLKETFFDHVSHLLSDCHRATPRVIDNGTKDTPSFEFHGGLIGYFGYEMKRESMEGYVTPKEQECACQLHTEDTKGADNCCTCVEEPDAAFQFVDRFMVFDQVNQQIYICCLVKSDSFTSDSLLEIGFNEPNEAIAWLNTQESNIASTAEMIRMQKPIDAFTSLTPASSACTTPTPSIDLSSGSEIFTADVKHDDYLRTIEQCVDNIREGEAYELCLTTRFRSDLPKHITTQNTDPTLWRLYTRHLRKNNPAPFSALLMFPRLGLLSSSPERFLKVSSDGIAEMKPIKGTVARVLDCVCKEGACDFGYECQDTITLQDNQRKQELWQDVKERAENLMVRKKER